MSTVVYRRQPRRQPPALPKGEILFESPPDLPEAGGGSAMGRLAGFLPIMAGGGAMAFMFTAGGVGGTQRLVMSGLIAVSMVGMTISQAVNRKSERKTQVDTARRDYSRYLTQLRGRVRTAVTRQRAALEWRYPAPDALPGVALSGRLWERRPADSDFAHARVASGRQRFAIQLVPPETKPVEDLDPVCAGALRRFVRAHNTVADLPVALGLGSFARVHYVGETELVRQSVRAQLCHLAAFHSPADLLVAACVSPDRRADWEWLKWLPHGLHPVRQDAVGRVRLVAGSMSELEERVDDLLAGRHGFAPAQSPAASTDAALPHLVIVVDGGQASRPRVLARPLAGVTVLEVGGPVDTAQAGLLRLSVTAADDGARLARLEQGRHGDTTRDLGRADQLSIGSAEAFARSIAGFRAPAPGNLRGGDGDAPTVEPAARELDLTALLGINDAGRLDIDRRWARRTDRDRLRIPFGVGADGRPVELDIKEAAQGGMGPHGLVIGATGSGKSELLRTLVLSMVANHSPDELNLVLVDFKGGATFLGLEELPHVSAVITNLEEELILVDRMQDAIAGEMNRRQELLRHAGNYASRRDYEAAREAGAPLDPLPTLWIVVDEFSELLSAKPEFLDLFVMIGRLGRSLGVHLLLASQRLEEGRLRGLDTHLSYRIGLRTFSTGESRSVLGVPDAYELPPAPGHGYLRFATEPLQRFRVAYAGAPYRPPAAHALPDSVDELRSPATVFVAKVAAFSTLYAEPRSPQPAVEPVSLRRPRPESSIPPRDRSATPSAVVASREEAAGTVFDVMVRQLQHQGRPAHQVWLPPLDVPATLDSLVPGLTPIEGLGLQPADWQQRGSLGVPIGLVDKPYLQRRDPLWIDLAGQGGNLAVVGAPQSGKSTLLRALVAAFSLTHTPDQAQFYCLDLGGGGLASLDGLPHVGGVAARLSADAVRRTVGEMTSLLDQRERTFGAHGVDSMRTYRRLRADGLIPADRFAPDVFLVVDGWAVLRAEYEPLETQVATLAARGLGYGIHVLASAPRWMDFRTNIKDSLQTRLELRVGDPYDSEVDRKAAANVPARQPGRGLTPAGMHFLTALPRIDGAGDTSDREGNPGVDDLADGSRAMAAAVAASWPGESAPRVRLLPDELPESAVGDGPGANGIPIGIDEGELEAVSLDFAAEPHFVVLGANECGKSNLLDLVARRLCRQFSPDEARIVVVDYRRSLLDSVPASHLLGYAASANPAEKLMADVAAALRKRLPGPDLEPAVLRSRSWWTGPDLYVVVDDYELVATSTGNPLAAIADLIPQAADVGLHVVLARGFGGAGRAMYDPVIQRIRDMGNPGLIMSGSRDEGVLWSGVRGEPMPTGRGQFLSRRHGVRLVQTALGERSPVG